MGQLGHLDRLGLGHGHVHAHEGTRLVVVVCDRQGRREGRVGWVLPVRACTRVRGRVLVHRGRHLEERVPAPRAVAFVLDEVRPAACPTQGGGARHIHIHSRRRVRAEVSSFLLGTVQGDVGRTQARTWAENTDAPPLPPPREHAREPEDKQHYHPDYHAYHRRQLRALRRAAPRVCAGRALPSGGRRPRRRCGRRYDARGIRGALRRGQAAPVRPVLHSEAHRGLVPPRVGEREGEVCAPAHVHRPEHGRVRERGPGLEGDGGARICDVEGVVRRAARPGEVEGVAGCRDVREVEGGGGAGGRGAGEGDEGGEEQK